MAGTVIQIKKSSTVSAIPSSLEYGELAINYADGKVYYKNVNNYIVEFSPGGGPGGNYFGTVDANGTLLVADTTGDILTLTPGNNITIVGDVVNDKATIGLSNDVTIPGVLYMNPVGGDEGGQIELANALTNSTLAGNVVIDIYQDQIRFYEKDGTNRGAYINLAIATAGVGSNLLAVGTTGGGGASLYANLDSISSTRYMVFIDSVTGQVSRANVSYGLRYNPSTNTLTTNNVIATGNVGIGTTSPSYKLEVNGSFAAQTKSFVINHPTKRGKKLRYGSLEGPENGVYIRGRITNENYIDLPDYWKKLVDIDSITVSLTPIGKSSMPSVGKITKNRIQVLGNNIDCFYHVFAERKDVDKLIVEI